MKNKDEGTDSIDLQEVMKRIDEEKLFEKSKLISSKLKNDNYHYDIEQEYSILKNKINPRTTKKSMLIYWQVAVVVLLLISISSMGVLFFQDNNTLNEMHSFYTLKAHRTRMNLADGSTVWLNSDTRFELSSNFSSKNRVVRLISGEAYFEVKKDYESNFTVETGTQKVIVHGTSFNIKAREKSGLIETTLIEGKIELQTPKGTIIMKPNEHISHNIHSNKLYKKMVVAQNYGTWKEGRIILKNSSFENLVNILELWYDFKIDFLKKDFKDVRFTGVVKHEKDIKHLLFLIKQTTPISYKIDNERIKIEYINY
jgi:ferric-dicitrate binding protein FerR (iron transport regulator)